MCIGTKGLMLEAKVSSILIDKNICLLYSLVVETGKLSLSAHSPTKVVAYRATMKWKFKKSGGDLEMTQTWHRSRS
jgi:hypothetical protein